MNRHEVEFIQDIVGVIWMKLNPTASIECLMGMDSHLSELSSCISIQSAEDVRIVGICGMGGIGKITIARAYFTSMSNHFEGSAFLADVREVSSRGDLLSLQQQLLHQILKGKIEKIWNVYEGIELIRTRLRSKQVLIVIDDVDKLNQLEKLAGKSDWFGSGSRIIITTRDHSLLVSHGVELNYSEGLKHFSFKAFKNIHPPKDYLNLSTLVVNYAGGLPLALEVLGSFLCGKNMIEWESALDRMKENPSKEILDALKINFDGLDDDTEREIFLDIACFFRGKDRHFIVKLLKLAALGSECDSERSDCTRSSYL